MTKNITVILFAALLLSTIGCNDSSSVDTETIATIVDTTVSSETEDLDVMERRQLIDDELPDKDYGGRSFMIYDWSDDHAAYFDVDTATGDIVNDAVYSRKITIENRFNVSIEAIGSGLNDTEHSYACHQLVLSGDDTYDMYVLHSMAGPNISMENSLLNLYDVPYINFEKPWWPKYVIDELTLMDQCYVFQAPISEDIISGSVIYYFNRDMINNYDLEDPYTLVKNGEWTMEKMESMIKDTYLDLNGNNSPDEYDQYGFATFIGETYYSLLSAGLDILTKTPTNLELTVNSEKTIKYVEKMHSLLVNENTHLTREWNLSTAYTMFSENRALFVFGNIGDANWTYRDTNINFGMIPLPKLDESQEDYITFAGRDLHGIPTTVKDSEFAGIIIEAMVAEGYKHLVPTYYENALKHKFVRDEEHYQEALEAVDLIEQTASLAFWYMYGDHQLFVKMGTDLIQSNSMDFASYYAKREKAAKERIDEIVEFFSGQ